MGVSIKSQHFFDLKADSWRYCSALHGQHNCFWPSMKDVETGRACLNHPESGLAAAFRRQVARIFAGEAGLASRKASSVGTPIRC